MRDVDKRHAGLLQYVEGFPAGDYGYVFSCLGKPAREVSADGPCPYNHDAHG
ncbi:hypothetical protein GCM10025785_19590 [Corynebacterium canis]